MYQFANVTAMLFSSPAHHRLRWRVANTGHSLRAAVATRPEHSPRLLSRGKGRIPRGFKPHGAYRS